MQYIIERKCGENYRLTFILIWQSKYFAMFLFYFLDKSNNFIDFSTK